MMLKCMSMKNPIQKLLHAQNTKSGQLKQHLCKEQIKSCNIIVIITSLDIIVSHYVTVAGLTVVTPNGKEKLLRATLLLSSADLPAKSRVSNMKQYNGEKGCSVCEDEGKTVGSGGLHRIWPYTTNMVLRTHKSVVESVRKVTQSGKPVSFDHPVYS